MEITELSARWVKWEAHSVRKVEDSLVKTNGICPRINASLYSPSKELKLVHLLMVKSENKQLAKAGVKRTSFWTTPTLCKPYDNCAIVIIGKIQSTSIKEMASFPLFLAANIIWISCNKILQLMMEELGKNVPGKTHF